LSLLQTPSSEVAKTMSKVMYTLALEPNQALLGNVKQMLGLADTEIDERFGVIEVDPAEHLYTILIEPGAAERLTGDAISGSVDSNPQIESAGLSGSGGRSPRNDPG
jgi:hypothetical protein